MGISELSSFCAVVEPVCDKAPGELVAKSCEICKPGVRAVALRAADPHCARALPAEMAQTAIEAINILPARPPANLRHIAPRFVVISSFRIMISPLFF
jgi:hypothetical protein